MYDDLHPNDSGYQRWPRQWFSSLQTYQGRPSTRLDHHRQYDEAFQRGTVFNFAGDLGAFSLAEP